MKILTLNCGSSSLKYRLIELPGERELAAGEAQRVGPPTAEPSQIVYRRGGKSGELKVPMRDHAEAFGEIMKLLGAPQADGRAGSNSDASKSPSSPQEDMTPDALGHRLVHGGSLFSGHILATPEIVARLDKTRGLAPLHNPPAIDLIKACQQRYPHLPQAVVFDTAYHSTIPGYAYNYALPRGLAKRLGIRKYGFHGTSHQFVASEAARMLGKDLDQLNAVSCHLGSGGASLCAIVGGKSMDNTMGFSPLQGLIMSTRCGDLDPAAAMRLLSMLVGDDDAVEALLNRRSGVLGMSGASADIRDVLAKAGKDGPNSRMDLTRQVYLWRIRKYLGSYLTAAAPAHAIIFTDTIGETLPEVRWSVCSDLECFGVKIDSQRNNLINRYPADVATDDSPVRILVILTNEELAIARVTYGLLHGRRGAAA